MFRHNPNRASLRAAMLAVCLAIMAACKDDAAATDQPTDPSFVVPVPTNLTATPGDEIVALSWAASTGATGYKIKRKTVSGDTYVQVAASFSPAYSDTTVTNGTDYMYVVSAFDTNTESGNSTPAAATPVDPGVPVVIPAAPTGLAAVSGLNAQVTLTWSGSTGATSYFLKRATTSGGPYTLIATLTATSYQDSPVTNGTNYYYVVSAGNSAGQSSNSTQVGATPAAPTPPVVAPPIPTGLSAVPGVNARVSVSWNASAGATSYSLKRSTTSGSQYVEIAVPTSTFYEDASVTNGTTYYYVVSARNSAGQSANSAQVSAIPVPPGTLPNVSCSNLGAPGSWKRVTPPNLNSEFRAAAFVVDKNTGIVYLGTDSFHDGNSRGVQRSLDCGETWQQVSTGINADAINGGRQWTFKINPVDGRIMYTNSGYYRMGLWKSYNGGIDWVDITPKVDGAPGFAGYLSMDPENPEHIFITWHDPCKGRNNEFGYADQVGCFHESFDGGRTWKGHYSTGTKWPSEVRAVILHGSTWLVLAQNVLRTTDGGTTFQSVSPRMLSGHSSGLLTRANNGDYYIGNWDGLYRSTAQSDGREWTHVGGQWVGELVDTGTQLFQTQIVSTTRSSPSGDGTAWTDVPGAPTTCERAAYESIHKVLYVSCGTNGFWRMVVP